MALPSAPSAHSFSFLYYFSQLYLFNSVFSSCFTFPLLLNLSSNLSGPVLWLHALLWCDKKSRELSLLPIVLPEVFDVLDACPINATASLPKDLSEQNPLMFYFVFIPVPSHRGVRQAAELGWSLHTTCSVMGRPLGLGSTSHIWLCVLLHSYVCLQFVSLCHAQCSTALHMYYDKSSP